MIRSSRNDLQWIVLYFLLRCTDRCVIARSWRGARHFERLTMPHEDPDHVMALGTQQMCRDTAVDSAGHC
jgi:hypothetical protein